MTNIVKGYRFNNPAHIAQAAAYGVIADNYKVANPMEAGDLVVVLAHNTGDDYIAMIGIATGKVGQYAPERVWPEWTATANTCVQGVKWIGGPTVIPAEVARKTGNRMSDNHAQTVFTYVMDRL